MADTNPDSESGILFQDDLSELLDKLHDCRAKWFDLGVQLPGLTVGDLRAIAYQYRDPRECLREMLILWLSRDHPHPSRKALAEALCNRAVGERQTASLISNEALLLPGSTLTCSSFVGFTTFNL